MATERGARADGGKGSEKATIGGRKETKSLTGSDDADNGKGARVKGQTPEDKPGEERSGKKSRGVDWHTQDDRHGGMHGKIDGDTHPSVKSYEGVKEGYKHTSETR